ncbi:Dabb family protein [Azospirillum griseum]
MINHVVLFQWRPEARADAINAYTSALAALPGLIPGILSYSDGPQCSLEASGLHIDWGFVMTFRDAAAREAYLRHPEYRRVTEGHNAWIRENVHVFDYSLPASAYAALAPAEGW